MNKEQYKEDVLRKMTGRVEELYQAEEDGGNYPTRGTLRSNQIRALAEWLAGEMYELKEMLGVANKRETG